MSKQRLSGWVFYTISHAYRLKALQIPPDKSLNQWRLHIIDRFKGVSQLMTFAAAAWPSFRTFTYSEGCLNAALAALRSCEFVFTFFELCIMLIQVLPVLAVIQNS